ncbi:MAG: hypothetical protein ACYTG2_07505 [Planctomycetota bacterium]|jgi:photosystem II stability/assembly factor-like uncharacterized protein
MRHAPVRALALLLSTVAVLSSGLRAHSPHDVVEQIAVSPHYAQDETVLAYVVLSDRRYLARSTDGGLSWQVYSSVLLEYVPSAIRFSPRFALDETVYIASRGGGVWRSLDGGTTWAPMNHGLGDPTVYDLAVSPNFFQDGRLLAATPSGVYRSEDGGQSWLPGSDGLVEAKVTAVAFGAPGGGTPTAYAGGQVIHASSDGGATWTPRFPFDQQMDRIAAARTPGPADRLLVCFGRFGGGVQASTDGASSWSPMVDGLTDAFVHDVAIANDDTVFASTEQQGCFVAPSVGGSWSLSVEGLATPSSQALVRYPSVDVSPEYADDGVVWLAAFEGVHSSEDGGSTWREGDVYSQRLNRRMVFAPDFAATGDVWLGNYGGGPLLISLPEGMPLAPAPAGGGAGLGITGVVSGAAISKGGNASGGASSRDAFPTPVAPPAPQLSARANGLPAAYTDVLAVSPAYATDRTVFYGHLGLWLSTDRGASWTHTSYSPSNARAIGLSPGFPTDGTLFVGSGGDGVWRSTDGAQTFTLLGNGLPPDHRTNAIELSPDFTTDGTLFVASKIGQFHRSTDGGDHFVRLTEGLVQGEVLTSVACSPAFGTDRTVFAGASGSGVLVSTDGGNSWSPTNAGLPEGEPLLVESLAVSPGFETDRTLYAAYRDQGVYRSTDGGATWTFAGAGLPIDAPRVLALSPAFPADRTLMLTTMDWTWFSDDAGESWRRLPGLIRVDETLGTLDTSGVWSSMQVGGCQGLGILESNATDDYQELRFFGHKTVFYASVGPDLGNVEILVDGVSAGVVSLDAPALQVQQTVHQVGFAEDGWHTLRVRNAGPTPENASGTVVSDGFAYWF